MNLKEAVERYRALAKGFGQPLALAEFGLSREETERLFSAYDEDYHISRFFHFTLDPAAAAHGGSFRINDFPQSHVSIDEAILEIL